MDTFPKSDQEDRTELDSVTIRFAGDSGDGMQLTGNRFTTSTALMGNDLATFPDYPAEIRAPAGTTYGVSGFQIQFASRDIMTPGDHPDVLVAMNPAALKVNIGDLVKGGLVIVNTGAFTKGNLKKAGYEANPLEDDTLEPYRTLEIDISKMTLAAVAEFDLGSKGALRCKNMWTLGLVMWMFGRETESVKDWLSEKFGKKPDIANANIAALKAGHAYAETAELPSDVQSYKVAKAPLAKGTYRHITGNDATAWGLLAASELSGLSLFLGTYPITPASNILHALASKKEFGTITFQAEDEIAGICSAIGASWAGHLAVTTTSGPGLALKGEALGLAIILELPLVVVDVQRGGPSTGLPTKTEQSDLLQAVYGRNGDSPVAVVAAATAGDCFTMAVEAARIATKFMTPVILLTDGYLGNGAEPWRIPTMEEMPKFEFGQPNEPPADFHPYMRDAETLARLWATPGKAGLEHRIGGLEKDFNSGNVSYDPDNHQKMTDVRAAKVAGIAKDIPEQEIAAGKDSGDLLVVGWGSTFGAIHQAVHTCIKDGLEVSQMHIKHLNPMPSNIGDILSRFKQVLVPEMNNGMLIKILRSEFLVDAKGLNKVSGLPFKVSEIEAVIREKLA
jgi:2-oxoglutarate ferredoxin oxidoreductase subunit alpha